MRKILFIHCAGPQGVCEGSNFLVNYLNNTIGEHYHVIAPYMPDPEEPQYSAWRNELKKKLKTIDKNSIIVGHSLGGSVILKYLAEEAKIKIAGLFLIATPYWGLKDWRVDEYVIKKDELKKLTQVPNIFLYHSKNDSVVPFKHLAQYAHEIPNAIVREVEDKGHLFSRGLPELIQDITKIYPHDRSV